MVLNFREIILNDFFNHIIFIKLLLYEQSLNLINEYLNDILTKRKEI